MPELTQPLAIFWGIVTLVTYLPSIFNKKFYKSLLRVKEREDFVILSGLISLISGAITLAFVHELQLNLAGLITLIGFLNVIKALVRFFKIGTVTKAIDKVKTKNTIVYVYMLTMLILGVYLLLEGFLGLTV